MEFFLELFLEIIFYTYFDFVQDFLEEKRLKPWLKYLLAVICFLVTLGAVLLVIIGIVFCADETLDSTVGTIMLIVGSVVLLIHILLAVFPMPSARRTGRRKERKTFRRRNRRSLNPSFPIGTGKKNNLKKQAGSRKTCGSLQVL